MTMYMYFNFVVALHVCQLCRLHIYVHVRVYVYVCDHFTQLYSVCVYVEYYPIELGSLAWRDHLTVCNLIP